MIEVSKEQYKWLYDNGYLYDGGRKRKNLQPKIKTANGRNFWYSKHHYFVSDSLKYCIPKIIKKEGKANAQA